MNIALNIAALRLWFWPRARRQTAHQTARQTAHQTAHQTAREIVLPTRQIWSATLPQGARVNCARGVIWLTQSDDATDFVLRAGQSFVAPRSSHVVVQAINSQDAILTIQGN